MPKFLVVLTYFLVAEDARTLEFCYPESFINVEELSVMKVCCIVRNQFFMQNL